MKKIIKEWAESIVIALALVIFVRTFFFQIYKIPTESMVPTLVVGDRIFVSKLIYGSKVPFTDLRLPGFGSPKRGDVVVFIPPHEKNNPFLKRKVYIKRLIGLEGETIAIHDGNILVDGKVVIDPAIAKTNYIKRGLYGNTPIVIPHGKYFFLGDNSANSFDGRYWGFVDANDIVGKAIFIWWPLWRIGMIE